MANCLKCGKETNDGLDIKGAYVPACDDCTGPHLARFRKMQADAAQMKAEGIHPDVVNRIMCDRVDSDYYAAAEA